VSEAEHIHDPFWDSMKIILFLLVFGSPIGSIFFVLISLFSSLFSESPKNFFEVIGILPLAIIFSYPLGVVPAFISSIGVAAYAWVFKRLSALNAVVITFILMVPFFFSTFSLGKRTIAGTGLEEISILIACSVGAAYFSYRLYYNWLSISKLQTVSTKKEISA